MKLALALHSFKTIRTTLSSQRIGIYLKLHKSTNLNKDHRMWDLWVVPELAIRLMQLKADITFHGILSKSPICSGMEESSVLTPLNTANFSASTNASSTTYKILFSILLTGSNAALSLRLCFLN